MSKRRATNHLRCPKCRINNSLCVCEHIRPIQVKTNVSIVVHVSELTLSSNSAQFVKHMAPDQTELFIRGHVEKKFTPDEILQRPGQPLFLFPSDDALELNADFLTSFPGPHHLIVPDGNWNQAKKVRAREEAFSNMMCVKLPKGIEAEYQLRKALYPGQVSTYEAIAHALGALEGDKVRDDLMTFFRAWVKRTMYNRTGYLKYADL
ncbi:MAG: tRNA-uridine aminocarboxypropyltransferase [Bacteriovoracaceae bacterium]